MEAQEALAALVDPPRVWSRGEVLQRPCPVPAVPGIYAWYFKELPYPIDTRGCVRRGDLTLLYVGISPKAPPRDGRAGSQQTLRKRICYHYRGNAEGSTLRLTLGCLLSERLGLQLRRVGSGRRLTFAGGEQTLSAWMADNAYVIWMETPAPWAAERELIAAVDVPLNLDQNRRNAFHAELTLRRARARAAARTLPVVVS
jgi:GIY-YIG catalytic domain-containing protein